MSHTQQAAASLWTTRRLLAWTGEYLGRVGVESPRLAAEMLLSHVLGVARLKLYMDPDRPANGLERSTFRSLVERAAGHEPVDYLVGRAPFFSMMLRVDRRVLIPRPSTETVVEHVIQHARRTAGFGRPIIADIGTGSGAIAVSLAKHLPGGRVIATDISAGALEVARGNAAAAGVADRIDFVQGDLLAAVEGMRFSYLVSNPPYISDAEWAGVARNVRGYEPAAALRGGADGLRYVRKIIREAYRYLDRPGQLVLEIAASQKEAVLGLASEAVGLSHAHVLVDHQALDRVLVANTDG